MLVHSASLREPSVDNSTVMFICLQHAKPWPSVGDNPTELQLIKQNHFPWIFFFFGSPVCLRILILAFYNLSAGSLLFKVRASHHWQEKRQQGSGLEKLATLG